MAKNKKEISTQENINLVNFVVLGMEEMKAESITIIDLTKIKNAVADYFVVCSGNSDSHVDAIAESVDKEVFINTNQNPWRKEGKQNREWILIDYVNIVAHVFKKEKRKLYDLEALWGDGIITHVKSKDAIPLPSIAEGAKKVVAQKVKAEVKTEKVADPKAKKVIKKKDTKETILAEEKPKKDTAKKAKEEAAKPAKAIVKKEVEKKAKEENAKSTKVVAKKEVSKKEVEKKSKEEAAKPPKTLAKKAAGKKEDAKKEVEKKPKSESPKAAIAKKKSATKAKK